MNEITFSNVSFCYDNRSESSIKNINLQIKKGEFVVITGKSGSGKTTLTRCLNGLIPCFYEGKVEGTVQLQGKTITSYESFEIAAKIGSVFQDPRSQFFTTYTTDEVAFGCENLAMPSHKINKNTQEAFDKLDINDLKNRSIFSLSGGEKQKIAIASVFAMHPEVFVLDEPTANLDSEAISDLKKMLRAIKNENKTIILSDHRLYYLMDLADRFIYMDDGKIVDEFTPVELSEIPNVEREKMGLRSLNLDSYKVVYDELLKNLNGKNNKHALGISHLEVQIDKKVVIGDLTLSVEKGEILGVVGKAGTGKTTLAKTICGLIKPDSGTIEIDRMNLKGKLRTKRTSLVMQDTDYQLFTESVKDEIVFGRSKAETKEVVNILEKLELDAYMNCHPLSLSGGQKQRVIIAACAMSKSDIVVFDEPTSGLDGARMSKVCEIIRTLSFQGKTILVISHDIEFLCNISNRIISLEG